MKVLPENLSDSEYAITDLVDAVWEGDVIQAEAGGRMTLVADMHSGCENYLYFTGTDTGWIGEVDIKNRYVKYGHPVSPLAINLGHSETDEKIEITISFSYATAFDPGTLRVIAYDLRDYAGQIETLKKDTEGKFEVGTNNICGTFDFKQDKILCLAVPYSGGWHAKVDGRETGTLLVNDLFTGVEVPEGVHEVELYYVTPGIRAGAGISIVSLLVIAGYLVGQAVVKNRWN